MSSYKITYFDGRGRAEASRLVLALAGQSYDDVRLTREQWLELKPNTKFGQLPTLEVDGKVYCQSRAMMIYLGRKFGYYPSDVEEAFQVDEVIFLMEDFIKEAIKAHYAAPEDKEAKMKEFKEVQVPKFNGFLEKLLQDNPAGPNYFVGDKITVADITVFDFTTNHPESLKDFPALNALVDRVGSIDKIKEWVDKRPESQF